MSTTVAPLERLVEQRRANRAEWRTLDHYRRRRARLEQLPAGAPRGFTLLMFELATQRRVAALAVARACVTIGRRMAAR